MTHDPEIILEGLSCCGRSIPACEICPFIDNCTDLEKDSSQLIKNLMSMNAELNTMVDNLKTSLTEKLEYIAELEDMVGMPHE